MGLGTSYVKSKMRNEASCALRRVIGSDPPCLSAGCGFSHVHRTVLPTNRESIYAGRMQETSTNPFSCWVPAIVVAATLLPTAAFGQQPPRHPQTLELGGPDLR